MAIFFVVLDIIGTIAFAISGALTAIKKQMDLFGVIILGVTTAVGGGAIRDLLVGISPPTMLASPSYTIIAICVAIIVFALASTTHIGKNQKIFDRLLFFSDSLGLGSFTVYGVSVGMDAGGGLFLVVFLGVITGVGGGVIRDIFAGNTPYIFTKHIYACASIAGALVCALLWDIAGSAIATLIGFALVVVIRFLAAHFKWNLPRVHLPADSSES